MDEPTKTAADTYDPLIEALLIVAKHYDKIFTIEGLTAGLPIENHQVNQQQFIQAAARANFNAKYCKASIGKFYSMTLPAILILKNNNAVVLERVEKKYAIITDPKKAESVKIDMLALKREYSGYLFQVTPTFKFTEETTNKKQSQNWLWRVIFKQMPTYSEVSIASFLVNIFALASPLFVMNVYDKVIPNQAFETLWTLALAVCLALIFDFILRELRTYFIDLSSRNVDTWFSASLFEQLLDIKMAARPQSIGTMINSVQSFESIKDFLSSTTIIAIVDFPFIITFLVIIFFLGGWLVLIPLCVIPFVLIISFLNQMRITNLVNQIVKLNSQKQAILVETLQNIQAVKLTLSEGTMQQRWDSLIEKLSKLGVKNRYYTNLSVNLSIFSQYFASVAIVVGGVYKVTSGTMRLGELIACTILTGRALVPVIQLAGIFTKYKQARASYELINQILDLPVERPEEKHFLNLHHLKGNIEFKEVFFSYPNQKHAQLENVSFKINSKEHLGIIGLNGSGKSTILKLILKLYDPSQGSILVDGIEIRQLDPTDLRRQIGYVPQEVSLFQGTIKDNIKIGVYGVDDEQLIRVSELSGLSRLIKEDPDGFNREVGERGLALSGGERQVIGLTRALLSDPSLLILDEPTNQMDEIASNHFITSLQQLGQEKTLILVTHKLELLKLVSRLIVVHRGKVVADGPRDEILNKLGKARAI